MLYRMTGNMEVVNSPAEIGKGLYRKKEFRVNVIANSSQEAEKRAVWKLGVEDWIGSPRNFQISVSEVFYPSEWGELGKWIFDELVRLWLEKNYHLSNFGLSEDILSKPEEIPQAQAGGSPLILYIPPGGKVYLEDPHIDFPFTMTPLILEVCRDQEKAQDAINVVFGTVDVQESMQKDGDHHSMTYGDAIFPCYTIHTEEAYALVQDKDALEQAVARA